MKEHESLPLQLKPQISYPREAQVGKTYLVSIDVQLANPQIPWEFPEEEYTIGFILNTQPYFSAKPLHGDQWPTVILHRYGGTYGPAEYLLTAADHEIEAGHMSITLINGWGIPMTRLELPCEVILEGGAQKPREIVLPPQPKSTLARDVPDPIQLSPEETEEQKRLEQIAAMLDEAGWVVVDDGDMAVPVISGIAIKAYPYDIDIDFLLLVDGEAVGIVTKEGAYLLLSDLSDALTSRPRNSIFQSLTIQTARDPLPFIYEMQGEEIHFTNDLEPEARSRVVFYFHRPETFAWWLKQAAVGTPNDLNDLLRSRLRRMPPVLETDLSITQFAAITALESSLTQNNLRSLIQVTNSSSIAMPAIYRLLKFGGARRILYLVGSDETAFEVFEDFKRFVRSDIGQTFGEIYHIEAFPGNLLTGSEWPDPLVDIHIMSIESIYHLLSDTLLDKERNKTSVNTISIDEAIVYHWTLPIDFFDVIFVVECFDDIHRRYRPLFDYFDAFFIGIGADIPSRTIALFNRNLVYQEQLPDSSAIAQRIWNYCDVLRDDGLSYGDYIEQLTYLLYLKMADEHTKPPFNYLSHVPAGYDWQSLLDKSGLPLEEHYRDILRKLGEEKGIPGVIFRKAINRIQDSSKLRRLIVDLINTQNWSNLGIDVKGDIYEGLLEKNAEDSKSGAGQYFTPRALISAIVDVMRPTTGMRICDPACGTGGFLLAAQDYIGKHNQLIRKEAEVLKNTTFYGWEIVDSIARLCVMNLFLHSIGRDDMTESPITVADSLLKSPTEYFDMVLSNPPFGRSSAVSLGRSDFWAITSNKQLNFLQHIVSLLKPYGRAAIVLPDNVLFEGGAGEKIRSSLLRQCDVHTLLRLPTGIFYAQGIKANVIFFDRMPSSEIPWTKELWIYDFRTNQKINRSNPFTRAHLDDFIHCYCPENRHERHETEHFHKFSYEELIRRDKINLDIFWTSDEKLERIEDLISTPEMLSENVFEDLNGAIEKLRGLIPNNESNQTESEE